VPSAALKRRPRHGGAPAPTREVILDTAERLFAARGVEGVAVRDLAREMGITASSLYNHFPGKQALYDAVLERGLGPILETVAVPWQDGLGPERVHATLDRLTAHLARHPHLARLLQRALLEQSPAVEVLLERRIGSLYREGMAVVRRAARDAGWEPEQVPHLGVALFGMIFAYFTNATALRRLAGWSDDLFSARALAVQRRFLEQAIIRLLGPRPRRASRRAHG
jgi:AcrR family transcriptional regulator